MKNSALHFLLPSMGSPAASAHHDSSRLNRPERRATSRLSSLKWFLLAATLGTLLPACVSRKDIAYHKAPGSWDVPYRIDCPARDVTRKISCSHGCPRNPKTKFLVVEFDDNGMPRNEAQGRDTLKAIREFKPENVLVYVHGWHNDSSPDCGEAKGKDMNDLDGLLHRMVEEGKAEKTLAIYIGWRGEIWNGLGAWFSLPNRRAVAGRIGSGEAVPRFLGDVASEGKAVGAKVIFSGHSLGAALLEKAAAQMIDPPGRVVDEKRLPHLFLLANSAEVANTSSLQVEKINKSSLALTRGEGTRLLAPLVLAVTSEKDKADRWWNFWFNYFVQKKLQMALGFERRLQTHRVRKSDESIEVKGANTDDLLFSLARIPRIDPSFWVLNTEQTKFTVHRMYPMPVAERKQIFPQWLTRSMSALIPSFDPPVKVSETNNELFWNVLIPGELSHEHNDVYNKNIIGAAMSWLRIAQPQLFTHKDLPDDLPELLNALRESVLASAIGATQYEKERNKVKQYVMAAATRMPRNEKCIKLLLDQLASPNDAASMSDSAEFRYRANLFYILKFTHDSKAADAESTDPRKVVWTLGNLDLLTRLMQHPEMWKALAKAGDIENSPEKDKTLDAFYKFLRHHRISPP